MAKFKKVWKKCPGNQWLRSHPLFLRAGDYFTLEGDVKVYMATDDPEKDNDGDVKIKHIVAVPNKEIMKDMNV
jgi:hypothetical protein